MVFEISNCTLLPPPKTYTPGVKLGNAVGLAQHVTACRIADPSVCGGNLKMTDMALGGINGLKSG